VRKITVGSGHVAEIGRAPLQLAKAGKRPGGTNLKTLLAPAKFHKLCFHMKRRSFAPRQHIFLTSKGAAVIQQKTAI
jgi:hypothetical protein